MATVLDNFLSERICHQRVQLHEPQLGLLIKALHDCLRHLVLYLERQVLFDQAFERDLLIKQGAMRHINGFHLLLQLSAILFIFLDVYFDFVQLANILLVLVQEVLHLVHAVMVVLALALEHVYARRVVVQHVPIPCYLLL